MLLLGTCVQSTASLERRAGKPAFRRNSFFIVPGMTTAQGTHLKNHNLGKPLTTPVIVLGKKVPHE